MKTLKVLSGRDSRERKVKIFTIFLDRNIRQEKSKNIQSHLKQGFQTGKKAKIFKVSPDRNSKQEKVKILKVSLVKKKKYPKSFQTRKYVKYSNFVQMGIPYREICKIFTVCSDGDSRQGNM